MHLIAENWSGIYGEYFRFRIGGRKFLAVANREAIITILRDRPDGARLPAPHRVIDSCWLQSPRCHAFG